MPAAIVFIVLAAIVVLVLVLAGARSALRRSEQARDDVEHPNVDELRYVVPRGHDPAAVLAALQREGYEVVVEQVPEGYVVLVACDPGLDRERARVRATIQHSQGSELEVPPVHFVDEQG